MKDPCDICLVRVTCWQECDDKINYAALLQNAMQNFGSGNAMVKYSRQFRRYLKLVESHQNKRVNINNRAKSMSDDY